jgi:hypothetical protein
MSDTSSTSIRPQPREAFGHPVATKIKGRVSEQKPGYYKSTEPVEVKRSVIKDQEPAILPPRNPNSTPKTSLSERVRQRLDGKEGQQ